MTMNLKRHVMLLYTFPVNLSAMLASSRSHLLHLLQLVTMLACFLDTSPWVKQLVYYTTVLFRVLCCTLNPIIHGVFLLLFIFIFVWFLCIICMKSIVNLLQYSTIKLIVLVVYPG